MLLTGSSSINIYLQLIFLLFVFFGILVAAYFATRWLGNMQLQQSKGKNMQLIEVLRISNNKTVHLIKIGERYFAMSVSKDSVTKIAEFNNDEIIDYNALNTSDQNKPSFKDSLNKVLNQNKKK
ncbi:flagellar protein FliO/FliZ [Natranaerovirga hydrolytica]|uniref:Flagellar protein FliO/FliZ n=1 Tax=Natranaerovirga hydrolytica TaxID=680378 RepID=A0A4R1N1N1_9FIRM|nr:flagellar biosynthetic protein FliO [Natranaerovirga hydrolytica]TCK97904.1 flagellar protein FliO/FliZ [Natranaerovirga hydrolytica]